MANQTFMNLGLSQETLLVFVLAASTVVHASASALIPCPIAALMRGKVAVSGLFSFGFLWLGHQRPSLGQLTGHLGP